MTCLGLFLEPGIDPSGGGATASVARSGVYDATQLLVDESASLRDYADRLRERGIFLEELELVGSGGNGGSPTGTVWDSGHQNGILKIITFNPRLFPYSLSHPHAGRDQRKTGC